MRQSLFALTLCIALAGTSRGHADHLKKYFPLAKGNQWTCARQEGNEKWSVSIADHAGSSYLLMGFPINPYGLWVAFTGETLRVWNSGQKKWYPLFSFGAGVGAEAKFSLGLVTGGTVHVKLMAKNMTVSNPLLGEVKSQGILFHLTHSPLVGKSTEYDFYLVPNVGIFKWSASAFLTWAWVTTTRHLQSGLISGKRIGFVSPKELSQGNYSFYPTQVNKALLFKNANSWNAFHALHHPNKLIPGVDFSKHSILAIILPKKYYPAGSFVGISKAKWKYPTNGVNVWVIILKTAAAYSVLKQPYVIVLLPSSVASVGEVSWTSIVGDGVPEASIPD